jgi:transposase, IS6 family
MTDARAFRGFRFPAEVILWAVRWYLQFPVSYRDLEHMLADRGVEVDHTTMYRWVQRFAPEPEKWVRRHLRPCRGPWHVDETYVRVDGEWRYLCRAVDGTGQTIDFLLSAKRDKKAAKRFFRKALGRENTRHPRVVVTDRLKSYPGVLREMKRDSELWRFTRHRRGRWLNNLVDQDHRRIKRRTRPMLGFQGFWTAKRARDGVEAMTMLVKGRTSTSRAGQRPAGPAGLRPPDLRPRRPTRMERPASSPITRQRNRFTASGRIRDEA